MKPLIVTTVLVVFATGIYAAARLAARLAADRKRSIRRKQLLTAREEAMYNRLTQALPDHRVLAQVSLGALLTCANRADRNRFDRKIADFVVCDAALNPIAVIELDDASHATKRQRDRDRDHMLTAAGYHTIRYSNVPNIADVQESISMLKEPQ